MARGGRPSAGKIVEAVPVDSGRASDQEFGGAAESEFLNFLGAEGGDPNFGYPHGQGGNGCYFGIFLRPFVNAPVVPVERKTADGDGVDAVEDDFLIHVQNKFGIDRGTSAEHLGEARNLG